MNKGDKYAIELAQKDSSWVAKIIRRVNRKQTVVSKKQEGFAKESEARAWAETELKAFLLHQAERNKRHAASRSK